MESVPHRYATFAFLLRQVTVNLTTKIWINAQAFYDICMSWAHHAIESRAVIYQLSPLLLLTTIKIAY